MAVSIPSTALDCTQRRQKISTASSTPRPSASRPSGRTGASSRSVIGPSISALVTSGIAIESPTPPSEVASMIAEGPDVGTQVRRAAARASARRRAGPRR